MNAFEGNIGREAANSDVVLPGTFLASSENGFILGQRGYAAWKCGTPGGSTSLRVK